MDLMNPAKARSKMEEDKLDVLVGCSLQNVFYMTGLLSHAKYLTPETLVFSLISKDEQNPWIITSIFDQRILFEKPSWVNNVKYYGEFYLEGSRPTGKAVRDPISGFAETISELKLEKGNIGIEETALPISVFRRLKEALPTFSFEDASSVFKELRAIKSDEEIRRIAKAAEITEKGIRAATTVAADGTPQIEVVRALKTMMIKEGGDPFFVQVTADPLSAGRYPTNVELKKGDVLRIDTGAIFEGYVADVARTFVIGKASEKQEKIYKALLKAQQNGIRMIKPGEKPSNIFKAVVDSVKQSGFSSYKRHHTGHGLGLELYEAPMINLTNNVGLQRNMVFNIEAPYYIVNSGGFIVEDTLVVTDDGYRCLTTLDRTLLEL